ncbi:alpha/beta hydrolase [Bacillus thuringiensis]|uniref:alpha/beta hydrolase n=1 Tax=Bacillus thuringiensis TaxID=1428 RepID=UPI000A3BE49E|nr:alpha/beta hydrolase [Bacillus thuringiensis]MED3352691.1 alpha/beta hydrolase [Bacillus thuringiensis]MRB12051.1 alpha/beta hydrolase fold domain-containing protein [Bacillus thuringiensis]OTX09918.1 lipase [Bacillus thuringiensis serovar fukuokaensis]
MKIDNRVLPELKQAFSQFPGFQLEGDLEASRSLLSNPHLEKSELVNMTKRMIPGAAGEMLVKIYEPVEKNLDKLPAMLWIHGGGYVMGHPDMDDVLCERFVQTAECVVVSVDYRLAPEHPYPAAIEDCYAGLVWMTNEADSLGIDVNRVAIAGASGGGGLTAALALMARDKGGPSIIFQMPLYPMLDSHNITPSSYEIIEDNATWNRSNNLTAWNMYLGKKNDTNEPPPYAVPSRADNLTGLPPTYTCVGQLDLFRDEIIEYVTRLAQAGVDVEFHLYPGCFHCFEVFVPEAEVSQRASQNYFDAMARALHP